MLQNTFCHIPGIGPKSERQLWNRGLMSWQDVTPDSLQALPGRKNDHKREKLARYAEESLRHLADRNAAYFGELLPSSQAWRLFPDFENSVAYLDIETTGLSSDRDYVTTIALYDGLRMQHFVRGENLDQFPEAIAAYKLLVTFNGKTFDVPFLRHHLGIPLPHAHIDLRYVMAGLGQTGGLKACERRLGLDRKELADLDGYFAVLLWHDYQRTGNPKSLETLLAYNMADVVNLAILMPMAYNMKIRETPFGDTHALPPVSAPEIPFKADSETIDRIQRSRMRWQ